jgi:hypothetical protein
MWQACPNFYDVYCAGYKSKEGARKTYLSDYWYVDYADTIVCPRFIVAIWSNFHHCGLNDNTLMSLRVSCCGYARPEHCLIWLLKCLHVVSSMILQYPNQAQTLWLPFVPVLLISTVGWNTGCRPTLQSWLVMAPCWTACHAQSGIKTCTSVPVIVLSIRPSYILSAKPCYIQDNLTDRTAGTSGHHNCPSYEPKIWR